MIISGKCEFIPYRVHKLQGNDIAIIAEDLNAWAIVDADELNILKDYLTKSAALYLDEMPESLKQLWEAGLLTFNGHGPNKTIKVKEIFPSSLLIKLTGSCNMSCKYCYDYDLLRCMSNVGFEKIKQSIDYLLQNRDNLCIVFHGGEPLLRFDVIKKTVEYINIEWGGKQVNFQMQTNGLLLNDEIISFLETHNISVGLSLDGITEETNVFRRFHDGKSSLKRFAKIIENYSDFIRNRCGILTVVSKTNIKHIANFALWLQDQGVYNLSLTFLDQSGKGEMTKEYIVESHEAIGLFEEFVHLIVNGNINKLNLTPILSRISNLYQFYPKDFCHKGPCAAFDDFLVLDSEGNFRTCDCIYHPFFEIGNEIEKTGAMAQTRKNILERHIWLKKDHLYCKNCALFSFCGGTCASKSIAANGDPYSIHTTDCAISQFFFPKLLNEFAYSEKKPLLNYFNIHKAKHKITEEQ